MVQPLVSPRKPTLYSELAFHLRVAARSDAGKVRPTNEDAFAMVDLEQLTRDIVPSMRIDVGQRGALIAVSDGMGGAEAGEVASAITVASVARALSEVPRRRSAVTALRQAVEGAHAAVRKAWDGRSSERTRMGATLTAIYVKGGEAFIAQVGDSRAYLVRSGEINCITRDQSMTQALVDSGVLKPGDMADSAVQGVILQAVGHQEHLEVALSRLALRDRDCLLLCSDGLTNHLSDDEIRDVILSTSSLAIASDQLVAMANERGGRDNITVVLAGVGGQLQPPRPNESVDDTLEVVTPFVGKIRR